MLPISEAKQTEASGTLFTRGLTAGCHGRASRGSALVVLVALIAATPGLSPLSTQISRRAQRAGAPLVSSQASAISPVARAYLDSALDIMQKNSLRTNLMNWPGLRRGAFALAKGASTTAGTYPAIIWALHQLGDHHSFFLTPAQARAMQEGALAPNLPPQGERLAGGVGLVKLPPVEGGAMQSEYATLLQQAIKRVDRTAICGWVVDLRGNLGGDMWPMLAGVGPILGSGVVGHFVFARFTQNWTYARGQASLDGDVLARVAVPYTLKHPMPPVAVLTDSQTASSGEGIAVAFRGRPETRSFGQPTAGVPTGNAGYRLSDGAMMFLTVAEDADRTGRRYDGPMSPSQIVPAAAAGASDSPDDPVVQAAVGWLDHQQACANANRATAGGGPG